MALIRKVAQHENSRMWAYIEFSDENPSHVTILGGREFATKEEATEWAKGFSLDSYTYEEPAEAKRNRLIKEKNELQVRMAEIEKELGE
jgi:hypothetical protein